MHTNKKIKGRHGNKKNSNKNKHTAYNVREQIQTRIHAPCSSLEYGWVIDSGTSAHMTPVRNDCKDIYPTIRQAYMTDGSSVVCRVTG